MKAQNSLFWLLLLTIFAISCKKEHSFEKGITNPSSGSLQSGTTGDCLGSVVGGSYKVDTTLADSNYVDVKVDVTKAGDFTISTDTINGFHFSAVGSFAATGENTVRLKGAGTPQALGTYIFTVTYDSTQCTFSVITVLGSGSSGTAVYTLQGAPGNCNPGTTQGTYAAGVATTSSNTATVNVDVTTVGTYSIVTTAVDGVTFSASGTFSGPGPQAIVLNATGTPATEGSFTVPVTVGSTTCSFPFTVGNGALDYFPRTTNSNWSYQLSTNDTLYQYVIPKTESALGNTYNIFMGDQGSGPDTLGYFRKAAGGDYYVYVNLQSLFSFDNAVWVEYVFLKDNVAAGTSWTSSSFTGTYTVSGVTQPVSLRFKETIQQKDVAVPVQGTTYSNTIVVLEEYEISPDGINWSPYPATITNYFSRNIGLIKSDLVDNSGSGASLTQELKRYQVF